MALPSLGAPNPKPGHYGAPGNPLQKVFALGKIGDNARGTVIETPILVVAVYYLYDKAFIDGEENRSWGIADVLFVIILAQLLKRFGVGERWRRMT